MEYLELCTEDLSFHSLSCGSISTQASGLTNRPFWLMTFTEGVHRLHQQTCTPRISEQQTPKFDDRYLQGSMNLHDHVYWWLWNSDNDHLHTTFREGTGMIQQCCWLQYISYWEVDRGTRCGPQNTAYMKTTQSTEKYVKVLDQSTLWRSRPSGRDPDVWSRVLARQSRGLA